MGKSLKLAVVVCLAALVPFTAHSAIVSPFDIDAEGWTTHPSAAAGALTHQSTGGNPGGHLRVDDTLMPNVFSYLEAPSKFLGNLSAYNKGTISFDAALLVVLADFPSNAFGLVTISGGGDSASFDMAPNFLPTDWTSYAAPLDAATWGKTEMQWASILADVSTIRIDLEPIGGSNEVVGFDNFRISAVPLPTGIYLFGAALFALGIFGRRRA